MRELNERIVCCLRKISQRAPVQEVRDADVDLSRVAAVIGESARTRMLVALLDGLARSSAELAAVARVTVSTASVHLFRLEAAHLVSVHRNGRNCFYTLRGLHIAEVLAALNSLVSDTNSTLSLMDTIRMPVARSCYDHIGGHVAVGLLNRFLERGWLVTIATRRARAYEVTSTGVTAFQQMGVDLSAAKALRRTLAAGCLDWHEGKYHLGGALGAVFAILAKSRTWVTQDPDNRTLYITDLGRRELLDPLGIPA